MKVRLVVVALALFFGCKSVMGADNWQMPYTLALININAAKIYESRQDYLGALVRYEMARQILARIHAKYPQWDTVTVERHMDDCNLSMAETRPLAAFQLAKLNNEWSLDQYMMESKTQWSALERAQAKVTYLEVLQINHPELTKAGMGEGVKEATKKVDALIDGMLAKAPPGQNEAGGIQGL